MITEAEYKEQLRSYNDILETVKAKDLEKQIGELQGRTTWDGFWEDHSNATIIKDLSRLEKEKEEQDELETAIKDYEAAWSLRDENEIEMQKAKASKLATKLEGQLFFTGKYDNRSVLMSIHSGAGGVDAQDFAAMLASMYQAFAKRQGWKWSTKNISSGDEGGLKSGSFEIEGEMVYGFLKEELGVHRLVRLSPFNAGNTRETSFASVEILPAGLENDLEIVVDDKDIRWDYYMASGKGGQGVNTTYSAVRITHNPSGIVVTCQNERDQQQNKAVAMSMLKQKLLRKKLEDQKEQIDGLKGIGESAAFGSQIRSYTMHPYKLVKDHRSKWESSNVDAVLDGSELEDFIWAMKRAPQD
jgi:peptide chain release factor 2